MAGATADLKFGFWVGLGLVLAMTAWAFLRMIMSRAGRHDG